ncbi:MAG TPA: molybdopterin-guanine dinucleotide biosynthesis protein MobA [Microbacteriaceae bacterium]|nr:molybdopterin-guanine dinucleotide biosynthesis protein MobA [Microbacteriaceae bacterium]
MNFDAIVLAGGRSARLGGEPKAALRYEGRSLLSLTLDAAADAKRTVVVGDASALVVPVGVLVARERPAFAGPAAAIAAGLVALAGASPSDYTLVLACDMPGIANAVPPLLERAGHAADGAIALDSAGHPQYLAGIYRTASLAAAVRNHAAGLENLSVRALLAGLELAHAPVPLGSTSDVDTWADVARFGIPAAPGSQSKETNMASQDDEEKMAALAEWSRSLSVELGVAGAEVDIDAVLTLAGTVAHAVMRPAAPLTTFIVGYAAGLAAADGKITPRAAFERAASAAVALARSDDR